MPQALLSSNEIQYLSLMSSNSQKGKAQIDKSSVEEPQAAYQTSSGERITFFTSFEEEHEHQLNEWRKMSPIERLSQLRQISYYAFGGVYESPSNRLLFTE